jgi:hypothetical protein
MSTAKLSSNTVLTTYKRLLALAQRLPPVDGATARTQIQAAFRASKGEVDPKVITSLLTTAHQKLSYLRMVTPKFAGAGGGGGGVDGTAGGGVSRMAVVGGVVREVGVDELGKPPGKAPVSSYGPGNLDPDQVRRHEALNKRMRFGDRPVRPKGPLY